MTVKRTSDPLGISPDSIEVDAGEGDDGENAAAWNEFLKSLSIEARIERCRRHPELIPAVEGLRKRAFELSAATRKDWMDWQFRAAYENLERAAAERDIATIRPLAQRDGKRQVGSSLGGKTSGEQRSEDAAADHAEWVQRGSELLRQGKAPRELAAILAKRFGMSSKQMRIVLQEAGLVKKREVK